MNVPEALQEAFAPLIAALPPDQAMGKLLVPMTGHAPNDARRAASHTVEALKGKPHLQTAAWIYVDELEKAHEICQDQPDETGSMWHAIIHRREGDYSNAKYWLHRAGHHPALRHLEGYDASKFVDQVGAATNDDEALVALQRKEWEAMLAWCLEHSK